MHKHTNKNAPFPYTKKQDEIAGNGIVLYRSVYLVPLSAPLPDTRSEACFLRLVFSLACSNLGAGIARGFDMPVVRICLPLPVPICALCVSPSDSRSISTLSYI